MTAPRQYRAGQSVEDYCRQCHEDRIHTVIVVDSHAQPLRVTCDFCRSEHNFRGGPRSNPRATAGSERAEVIKPPASTPSPRRTAPYVNQAETPPLANTSPDTDFEAMLRRVIREVDPPRVRRVARDDEVENLALTNRQDRQRAGSAGTPARRHDRA